MSDMVNSPQHYSPGEHEVYKCLAAWGLEGEAFAWTACKYIARYEKKNNPVEDLKKARWYIDKLIEKLEAQQVEVKKVATKALVPAPRKIVQTTDGYCDTCGDMYVIGYEAPHAMCKKE